MKNMIKLKLLVSYLLLTGICVYGATNIFMTKTVIDGKPINQLTKIMKLARHLVGKRYRRFHYQNRSFDGDCSGFIRFLFSTQGINLIDPAIKLKKNNGAYSIFYSMKYQNAIHYRKTPAIGDLVFFNESYDRNRDKKVNDLYTHVGIVDEIQADGTIVFIHHLNSYRGIRRDKLNLRKPNDLRKNSHIRDRRRYPNPKGLYLTGQLFAGFATVCLAKK